MKALVAIAALLLASATVYADKKKPAPTVVDDEDPLASPTKKAAKPEPKKKAKVEYTEDPAPKGKAKADPGDKAAKKAPPKAEYVDDKVDAKKPPAKADEPKGVKVDAKVKVAPKLDEPKAAKVDAKVKVAPKLDEPKAAKVDAKVKLDEPKAKAAKADAPKLDEPKPKAKSAKPGKKAKVPEPAEIEIDPVVMTPPPPPEPAIAATSTSTSTTTSTSGTEIAVRAKRPALKRFYVRAGVAYVAPIADSREMELADVDGAASLAVQNGPIAGSGATVSAATIPAIIIGYKLTSRWSLETIAGVPFTVKFKATGTLANESIAPMALGIPTGVPALGADLGEAKAVPPLITATYQLSERGAIRPYVGAGVSVLFAFDGKMTNPLLTEVSQPVFTIKPAPGLVLQTGAEARLWKNIYARLDVKFIAFMLAEAEAKHIQVRTPELPLFDTVEVGTARMSVWVNPLIVQLGIGADF